MENQIKLLTATVDTLRMETQRKDPAAWGVRMCTLCGRAGHEAHFCSSGGRGGQSYNNNNYGQTYQNQQPM